MPDSPQIVSLYDDQVKIKFHAKGHKYYRKFKTDKLHVTLLPENELVEINTTDFGKVGEWELLKSVTGYVKKALDKPKLQNWFVDVTANAFKKSIEQGLDLEKAEGVAKGARGKIFRQAGKDGTRTHEIISNYVQHRIDYPDVDYDFTFLKEENSKVKNAVRGTVEWLDQNVKKYLYTEFIVYNPIFDVVGTLDLIFIDNQDHLCIFDLKTGSAVYAADIMQAAFYRSTFGLQQGKFPDKMLILHADKNTGKVRPIFNSNHEANLVAFQCAKYLVTWESTLNL